MLSFFIKQLTFDTASAYALHNILSKENKYKEQGKRNECDCRHLTGVVSVTRNVVKGVSKSVCYKSVRFIICYKTGPHIGVPSAHHLQYSY